jgi:hypothetical protein
MGEVKAPKAAKAAKPEGGASPVAGLVAKFTKLGRPIQIGAAAALVLVVVVAVVVFAKGGPTEKTVDNYLITAADLGDINNQDHDPTDFTDSAIFNSDCSASDDLGAALGKGNSWGNAGFEESDDNQNSFWITEQIIGFDTEAQVDDVLAAVDSGAGDSDCDYASYTSTLTYTSPYDSAEKLGDVELPGNGLLVQNDTSMTMGTTTVTSKGSYVFAKRGNVLAVMSIYQGDTSFDENITTYSDLIDIAKTVLNRFNG